MTDEQMDELKTFISTVVRNEVNNAIDTRVRDIVREEIDTSVREIVREELDNGVREIVREEVKKEVEPLRQEMRDGFEHIDETVSRNNDELEDHSVRLTELEQKAA